jgi:hypothetical protein
MRLHDKINQVVCEDPVSPRIVYPNTTVTQVYLYKNGYTLGRVNGRIVRQLSDGVWFFMELEDVPKNVTAH